jgi:hypothetical protein
MPDPIPPFQCQACQTVFSDERPAPQCNWCGERVCLPCRQAGKHLHADGWCPGCTKVQRLETLVIEPSSANHEFVGRTAVACSVCGFEWTPTALRGLNSQTMICALCGACQLMPGTWPTECKRCGMMLV